MKVLVTGATGFLGKYVVKELVTEGYFVRAFGRNEAVGQSLVSDQVEFFKGDLLRIVKNKEGQVFIDPTGKANGRGTKLMSLVPSMF